MFYDGLKYNLCSFVFISGEDMPSTVVTLPHPLPMKRNLRDGEVRVVAGQ